MFYLAIFIGIYSYIVFFLGLAGLLYKQNIVLVTLLYLLVIIIFNLKNVFKGFTKYLKIFKVKKLSLIKKHKLEFILVLLICLQAIINLVGALGPELAFDALWYHLTLPKLYLLNNRIDFIDGGLFYYSAMPQLTEMLYISALSFNNEILAKVMQFIFGILICVVIYKFTRKYYSSAISLIAVVVFYSNLVVAWESITAYIDLSRTFFEILALLGFSAFISSKKRKWLILSSVMVGLAISTKLLALGSVFIFCVMLVIFFFKKETVKNIFINLFLYVSISLLIPLPWFIFSYINTSNPVYPFFSGVLSLPFDYNVLNPLNFLEDSWILFTKADDPISPLYIILLPVLLIFLKKLKSDIKIIAIYSLLAFMIWYLLPRIGGGRYILPYLPAFSIVVAGAIGEARGIRVIWGIRAIVICLVILVSLISIIYRGVANKRYLPVILSKESKQEFLTNNLNFSYGDFLDTDSYFKKNIKSTDRVLLYGFHNLYYINFSFVDSSFIKKGDKFNFITVQNSKLPERFNNWRIIYSNKKTNVQLYTNGGKMFEY